MYMRSLTNYVVNLIIAASISFSFVYALTSSLNFTYTAFEIFLLVFAAVFIYSIALLSRFTLKLSAVLFGFILTGGVIYSFFSTKAFKSLIYKLFSSVIWIYDYINETVPLNNEYQNYTIYFLCILITLLVYIFTAKKFNFFVLLASGIVIFVSQWTLEYFVSYLPFYVFLFFILVCYFKYIFIKNSSVYNNDLVIPAVFSIWSAPICGIVFALSVIIPASEKPIEWKWLDSRINATFNYFNEKLNSQSFDYFSISATGFGEGNSRLGGKVMLDKTLVLKVDSPRNVYLKGACKDIYTGSSWMNSDGNIFPLGNKTDIFRVQADIFELTEGIKLLTGDTDFIKKFFYKDTIKISYENLKTKSIFTPVKTGSIKFNNGPVSLFTDTYGVLSSEKILGKKFNYHVELYSIKYGDKGFQDILRKSRKGLYNEYLYSIAEESGERQNSLPLSHDTAQRLSRISHSIYAKYLQVPEKFPQRVKELAEDITSSAENNYDKVKAIEQYLSNNYPYTLNPRNTPKGRDFVDYFLFDLKQGYCTYYATAMTMLVRSIGIPARYVEGYILPPKPSSGNTYEITNERAHAWVEVYFEGFGWLPFEATSPFSSSFYNDAVQGGLISGSLVNDPYYLEYMKSLMEYGSSNIPYDMMGEYAYADSGSNTVILWLIVPACAVLIFLGILIFNFIKHKLKMYRISKMPPQKCVLAMYKYYIKILAVQNLPIRPGETPGQYAQRADIYMLFRPISFKSITDIFLRARYSAMDITEKEKQTVLSFYEIILNESRKNLGKVRYYIYRRLLGII